MNMRRFFQWTMCLVLTFAVNVLYAAPVFPALTGRVVDNAHILKLSTVAQLDKLLANYERGTTNQVVVATIASLQGYTIEDYGYQLGRYWKIGQAGKNNGVVFIVAPKDRKVRIEVGYGLEPILTDAISSTIIQGVVLPNFRAGHVEQGVVDGTQAIVSVLGGKGVTVHQTAGDQPLPLWLVALIVILFFWFMVKHPLIAAAILSSRGSRFGGDDSGGGGGGFSGGGGGFGGGGSSGSW